MWGKLHDVSKIFVPEISKCVHPAFGQFGLFFRKRYTLHRVAFETYTMEFQNDLTESYN